MLMYVALILADLVYGITDLPWDHQLTKEEFTNMLKQVECLNACQNYVVIFWHKPDDSLLIRSVMEDRHFRELTNFFWHKTNHYTHTPPTHYTSSIEMCTIGYLPSREKCPNLLNKDPRKRHNFISLPPVTNYLTYDNGDQINPCQKPIDLAYTLVKNHVEPGGNVLVLGSGAGGEVMGAVAAGCNVVAIEKDVKQFNGLVAHLIKTKNAEIEDDRKKAKLLESQNEGDDQSTEGGESERSQSSTPTYEKEELPDRFVCKECDEVIEPPIDLLFACSTCIGDRIFHPNCCRLVEGAYQCLSCIEEREIAEESGVFDQLGLKSPNGQESEGYDEE